MDAWLDVAAFGLTLFVMLVGLIGSLVPIFPGIVVIWLGALGYGIVKGFGTQGVIIFILITLAMLAGVTVDNLLMGYGARRGGAAWRSIIGGILAGIIGTVLFPPVGGLIAAPAVVLLMEWHRGRSLDRAWKATGGLALGWVTSIAARFGLGLLMIGLWLIWAL